jgi:predicted nucleic acid-binding protein
VRVALDTNILAYAEGVNVLAMKRAALALLDKLPQRAVVLPVQVLGELFQCAAPQSRPLSKARTLRNPRDGAMHLRL